MFQHYNTKSNRLRFAAAHVKIGVGGAALVILALLLFLIAWTVSLVPSNPFVTSTAVAGAARWLRIFGLGGILAGLAVIAGAVVRRLTIPDTARICQIIRRGLCDPVFGNPLHLRDGDILPKVKCDEVGPGLFNIIITGPSVSIETISNASSRISSLLTKRFEKYAVVTIIVALDYHSVTFRVEDVTTDLSITYHSAEEMRPKRATALAVQKGTFIDLKTAGSVLVAGKTRSGKTTAIISLLLQVLLAGRDEYGSEVVIIDPKQAELSRLPHTVTLDDDGEARGILEALRRFAATIKQRQAVLNDLSQRTGDAVHWWDAHMRPSILFVDEYVACRSLLPRKAEKGDSDYCLTEFDNLVKRIVTMGASAGCYIIISIAQASVEEGGLPSMLRSAMTTKILMRPTLEEGRLMWPGPSLETLAVAREYIPGDAWFSSTDGAHDAPGFVHFPHLDFPAYAELGRLLREYYGN